VKGGVRENAIVSGDWQIDRRSLRERRAAEIHRCFRAWRPREIVQAMIAAKQQNGRQTLTVF